MKEEPATILVVELGAVFFFMLLLPLLLVLGRLRAVWQVNRGAGLVLVGVIFFTALFFAIFFAGIAGIALSGVRPT